MKYPGSKLSISGSILRCIFNNVTRSSCNIYIEPFVGGANIIDKVDQSLYRLGSDSNEYLIEFLKSLQNGWIPPYLSREDYYKIKENKESYEKHLVGYAGVCCAYSGNWFGSYAGRVKTKKGYRDYQEEAIRNVIYQSKNLKGIDFVACEYDELIIPDMAIIYCDPPYSSVYSGYSSKFNTVKFWEWARGTSKNNFLYVSEYSAPSDFHSVLKIPKGSTMYQSSSLISYENLFVYSEGIASQIHDVI